MNTKLVLAACLVVALLGVMPVSAFNQQVEVCSQAGGLPAVFSMSIVPGTTTLTLAVGTVAADGPSVTIASNTPYTIAARDSMLGTKPAGAAGYMLGNKWTTGAWHTSQLANKFKVGVNGGTLVPMTSSDQTIRTGTVESFTGPLKFEQAVVVTDPVLPSDCRYEMMLEVTGTATP